MYLDTAILVKLVAAEPESSFYGDLVEGQADVWSSELVLVEAFAALLRKEREGAIGELERRAAWREIESQVERGSLHLVPITRGLLARAASLLETCHPVIPLRSLDAIHLASFAECRSAPLVTSDGTMRAAAARLGFDLAPTAGGSAPPPRRRR